MLSAVFNKYILFLANHHPAKAEVLKALPVKPADVTYCHFRVTTSFVISDFAA
jgi:hypothetical protein